MSEAPLLFAVADDGVATITLHRPHAGNAITLPMVRALAAAAAQCVADGGIGCVLLTGAGRLFCAGGDLDLFRTAGDGLDAALGELAALLHGALLDFARMAPPMVVAVNGPAAGAGLSLAIGGDVVLCARSAHFTAAYGALGLTPDGGMSWRLPRLVGLRRAQEIILTNRRIGAEEAVAIGMATRVIDDDALPDEALAIARRLAAGPTHALAATRRLLLTGLESGFAAHLDAEARAIAAAARHPDTLARIGALRS